MLVSDFHYDLPPERIAQEPLADRSASRLLHLIRDNDGQRPANSETNYPWEDRWFREFPDLLRPSDLLVLNNTRVFPARLYGRRSGKHAQPLSPHNPAARDFLRGQVEVLLTRQVCANPNEWECLVRPGRKIGVGEKLYFGGGPASDSASGPPVRPGPAFASPAELEAEVIKRDAFGERVIRFAPLPAPPSAHGLPTLTPAAAADFFARLDRLGHVPLPPYIAREDCPSDRDRYQTVYAKARGSVAAPTAGLHFTPEILEQIRARGIEMVEVTLHVGLGTFQPVRVERVEDHKLHSEWYEISAEAARAINMAKTANRRIVAVGTTTVRTLEDAAERARADRGKPEQKEPDSLAPFRVEPGRAEASAFIYPGHRFRIVDALLTNFHLPQSTLLMLVCALAGRELVLRAYRHAVESRYRFYSYGDCMFVE